MISDREMKLAAEELFQAMLASLPDECSCVYSFSEKFEEKMRKLIYATNHPKRRRILQRVATIILIFTFGFATLLALCPSVRASIFGWVKTQYDSFTKYYFDGSSDSNNDFSAYGLHYLPTGYTEIDRIDLENESSIYYLNEETSKR